MHWSPFSQIFPTQMRTVETSKLLQLSRTLSCRSRYHRYTSLQGLGMLKRIGGRWTYSEWIRAQPCCTCPSTPEQLSGIEGSNGYIYAVFASIFTSGWVVLLGSWTLIGNRILLLRLIPPIVWLSSGCKLECWELRSQAKAVEVPEG